MNRKKVTLAATAVGVVGGVVGLAVLAVPAGAGPAPSLPDVSAEALVQSVLTAKPAALGGTVQVQNNLGIPSIPGLGSGVPSQLTAANSTIRMWTDGTGKVRVSLPTAEAEQTLVDDGTTRYAWDSSKRTVVESPHGKGEHDAQKTPENKRGEQTDPVTMSTELVSALEKYSTITVDGTAKVAGRSAYNLVLTPKPDQRTLVRDVSVSIDSELRLPLRVAVFANGSADPVAQIGFTDLNVGPQDASLFTFQVPAGAKVVKADDAGKQVQEANKAASAVRPQIVGEGWSTTLVAEFPTGALGSGSTERRGSQGNPADLIRKAGTPVSGPWGSGTLIKTKVATALITSDGRVAVGLVPEQVLYDAIGKVK